MAKLLNHYLEIGFLLVGIFSILLAIKIFNSEDEVDGYRIKLYGYIVSAVALGLTIFYAEKKSSKTSKETKENIEKNLILSSKIDTTTIESKESIEDNLSLTSKIDTTTTETRDEVSKLKQQNKQLKLINEQQNIVLKGQGLLLNEQLSIVTKQFEHIKNTDLKTLYADFTEYQLLKQKFQQVSHMLYQSSAKESFLALTTEQIIKIKEDSDAAIDQILFNKFVSTDNRLNSLWAELKSEISFQLYSLKLMVGVQFKSNNVLYTVDETIRNEKYDKLQLFLRLNSENRVKRESEILYNK